MADQWEDSTNARFGATKAISLEQATGMTREQRSAYYESFESFEQRFAFESRIASEIAERAAQGRLAEAIIMAQEAVRSVLARNPEVARLLDESRD